MRVLCVGDVVGGPGRRAMRALLPGLRERTGAELVIANGENAAGGVGLTPKTAQELRETGVDVITGGNHLWKHKEIVPLLESEPWLLRPLNYPGDTPGRGLTLVRTSAGLSVGVINVQGRAFMEPLDCPFRAALQAAEELSGSTRVILVDFHAEATSEKRAMGWLLEGKVSAVFGTHTHVPTADEEILGGRTGYITDLGMTGPYDSVIGSDKERIIDRFLSLRPVAFGVAHDDVRLCGAVFDIDPQTGHTRSVERIRETLAT